ncbi:unnamed protein product [Musa textilis]
MADSGGAASALDTTTGRRVNSTPSPSLDGAFLLQLLQNPPQPSRPSASHSSSFPHQCFGPAVAAVGPIDCDPRPTPPPPGHFSAPLLFHSPPLSLPQGLPPVLFPPPGFFPFGGGDAASSSHGPGNQPFFPFDHQRLGVSAGVVHPLAASPPSSDLVGILGHLPNDRNLVDQTAPKRNISGSRGRKDRSSLRPPPGFQKLQNGKKSTSRSSDGGEIQWKPRVERSNGSIHRSHQLHTDESNQDAERETIKEENGDRMHKLEIRNQGTDVSFYTKSKGSGDEDDLWESKMNSATLKVDREVNYVVTHISSSRSKDSRSDHFRGHHVSTQRMRIQRRAIRCRHDMEALNSSFLSIFESLVPAEEEKAKQMQFLLSLQNLVNKEWPNAKLHLYGSCANSFGVSKSDIDVCLAIDDHDLSKSDILLKLADILQSGNLQNVQALTHARVPIVKLIDPVTGLSCDICVNNLLAVVNTKLLKDYAQIDKRLHQLAFLVKHWARSRRVNETYQGTLSSYAYVLMCIHFLQLRKPAILPCLQAMDATYTVTVDNAKCTYFDQVERLRAFGVRNKESIARLLWAFFHYWAYHHDYTNDVISIRTGSIISKRAKDWTRRIGNDRHLICIEDPFDISHDLGRVVDKFSIKILREEFERAANILQYDPNPCVTLFQPYVPGSPPS